MKMEQSFKEMSTFVTCSEAHQFEVVAFGLINAPVTFRRMMDKSLHHIPFSRAYSDNVVVLSKSKDEHLQHLEKSFLLLEEQNLKL